MELVTSVIEWLNSPAVPLWVKFLILAAIVGAAVWWLAKPPHWADAETPTPRKAERLARPPD